MTQMRGLTTDGQWIEYAAEEERATDPYSPYRLVTASGQRFGLSTNDAIRAQKSGVPFRAR